MSASRKGSSIATAPQTPPIPHTVLPLSEEGPNRARHAISLRLGHLGKHWQAEPTPRRTLGVRQGTLRHPEPSVGLLEMEWHRVVKSRRDALGAQGFL